MRYKTNWLAAILAPMLIGHAVANTTSIAAGDTHTVFIDNGTVYAMGLNRYGAVKPDNTLSYNVPQQVGISNAVTVSAGGSRSAALTTTGSILMWGRHQDGYPMSGTGATSLNAPTAVPTTGPVSDIAMSASYLFYVQSGSLFRWDFVSAPQQLTFDGNIIDVAAGSDHAVVLYTDGTIGTTGTNTYGQLGNGTTISSTSVVKVPGISNVTSIATGRYTTFATTSAGDVYGFGKNAAYQFGNGTTTNILSPTLIPDVHGATKIAPNDLATVALMPNGTLMAAGFHDLVTDVYYNSSHFWTPIKVSNVKDVASGWGQSFLYVDNATGKINGWAMNRNGLLGDGSTISEQHVVVTAKFTPYVPTPVVVTPTFVAQSIAPTLSTVSAPVVTPTTTTQTVTPAATQIPVVVTVTTAPVVATPIATPAVTTSTQTVTTVPTIPVTTVTVTQPSTGAAPVTATYSSMNSCIKANPGMIGVGDYCRRIIVDPHQRGNGN